MQQLKSNHEVDLLNRVMQFQIGPENTSLSFEKRLARDNNWSIQFAKQAIIEYKKFIYLIASTNSPKTPSDAVDQVWHLHLNYTESYWDELCQNTIGRNIHHGPTKGGASEGQRYREQYIETLESYHDVFGIPPSSFWPDVDSRFSNSVRFQRVDTNAFWSIKKPSQNTYKWACFFTLPLLLTACVFTENGSMNLIFIIAVIAVVLAIVLRSKAKYGQSKQNRNKSGGEVGITFTGAAGGKSKEGKGHDSDGSDGGGSDGGGSGCGSGCGGG